jgi:hypothetical protein
MTINQALDKILSKYKNSDMEKFPDIATLKVSLIEKKMVWGGNYKLEHPKQINKTIETGKG